MNEGPYKFPSPPAHDPAPDEVAFDEAPPKPPRIRASGLQQLFGLSLSLLLIWAIFGRGGTPPTPAPIIVVPTPRVASTSPAITDSLVELGLAAHLVGRSPYCSGVSKDLPVVGDLRDFDAERLALAKPEVLFVQPPLAGVDPALQAYCTDQSIRLVERRLDTLEDLALLADDFESVFGAAIAPKLEPARRYLSTIATPRADAPRVLLIVSADPFLAVGRGNYLNSMLERCGFVNAVESKGWVELSVEAVVALAPARIVGLAQTESSALAIEGFAEVLPWPAAPPPIASGALPALLSPSFAAIARQHEFAKLLGVTDVDHESAPAAERP